MTRKVPFVDLKSQLDSVWNHQFAADFKQLITENSAWFVESVVVALL